MLKNVYLEMISNCTVLTQEFVFLYCFMYNVTKINVYILQLIIEVNFKFHSCQLIAIMNSILFRSP